MSNDGNKALVRRFYEEIDKGNIDAMDDLVAVDYINHDPPPFPGLAPGRAGLKEAFAGKETAGVADVRRAAELARKYAYEAVSAPAPPTCWRRRSG